MNSDDRRRHGSFNNDERNRDFDDSFQDQRNPPSGAANQPRDWQGSRAGGQGNRTDGSVEFDRRSYGRGNQFGQAGQYGREHEYSDYRRQGFSGDYDRSDDYGRGDERIRGERHGERTYPGVHGTERGESLRSRSADPGQSSYGGFSNEDPRFQRQQFEHYEGGRGYGGFHQGSQGGQQQGWRSERQQRAYGPQRFQPKGYTRSDERVREDICEQLSHSGLDVSDVSVSVAEGKVTLEGTVSSRQVKHTIENCADDCMGVKDVDNRITVKRSDPDAGAMAL